jgi:hypothetical protein
MATSQLQNRVRLKVYPIPGVSLDWRVLARVRRRARGRTRKVEIAKTPHTLG